MENNELHYEKLEVGAKKYFINLKKAANGDKYISINHSWKNEEGNQEYSKILLFEEQFKGFVNALYKVIRKSEKIDNIEKLREIYPNAYEPWTEADEEALVREYINGRTVEELSEIFARQPGAIEARLSKLNVVTAA